MTHPSETPAAAAARRARMLDRQARIGILRNPNTPPRPPQRKARLMGKWPNLQSTRRPDTLARSAADTIAPAVTDTDLARMMKEAPPLPPCAVHDCGEDNNPGSTGQTPPAEVVIPLPDNSAPSGALLWPTRLTAQTRKRLVLIAGFSALLALAFFGTAV